MEGAAVEYMSGGRALIKEKRMNGLKMEKVSISC